MKGKKSHATLLLKLVNTQFLSYLREMGKILYRMGSFKIFAEVVRFFFLNQSVFYASLFHSAIKEIYIDYWNFKNKFAN